MAYPLILASRSPQRYKLLQTFGLPFSVLPAHIDETPLRNEAPLDYVVRIARAKAQKIAELNPQAVVIAADTPCIVGRHILQTPQTEAEAAAMMQQMSGRRVLIPTVVAMAVPGQPLVHKVCHSWVKFSVISAADIAASIASGQWKGVSGELSIENGQCDRWIKRTSGSVSGIIGLPLYQTGQLLRRAGYQV